VNESIEDEGDATFVRVTLRVSNGYAILVAFVLPRSVCECHPPRRSTASPGRAIERVSERWKQ
jgi:hypothetical protein